ncbi:hypothetical protein [Neisseria sp. Ec49-e6-T10]|uniref:hypothetical protein n=1 Tax=Neisseria sp. Ec49-e6-T10 TaxID=3140744 RepID=UPI003EBCC90A
MKKYNLFALIALTFTSVAFAAPTVQDCTNEILAQKAANTSGQSITTTQAKSYCECTIPKLNKLLAGKDDLTDTEIQQHQKTIENVLNSCAKSTGLEASPITQAK